MDVDSIVERFRQKMWTGTKTKRDEENAAARLAPAQRAYEFLSENRGELRLKRDALLQKLSLYSCEATYSSHAAMSELIHHLYNSATSTNGQWGIMIKHFAFLKRNDELVSDGGAYSVYREHGHETPGEEHRLRLQTVFRAALPDFVDQAEAGLRQYGFLRDYEYIDPQQEWDFPSQQMDLDDEYSQDEEEDAEEVIEDQEATQEEEQNGGDEDAVQDEPEGPAFPDIGTHEELLQRVLGTLPDNHARAEELLLTEDNSMFSHAGDFFITYTEEGGAMQLPEKRGYYYRNAQNVDGSDIHVSDSNTNADIAAALRSLVLLALIVVETAKTSSDCGEAFELNKNVEDDGRYPQAIELVRYAHVTLLQSSDAGRSNDIFERQTSYELFQQKLERDNYKQKIDTLKASRVNRPAQFVDLLLHTVEYVVQCLCERYTVGLGLSGGTSIRSYPSPMFSHEPGNGTGTDYYGGEGNLDAGADVQEVADDDGASDSGESHVSEILPIAYPGEGGGGEKQDLISFEDGDHGS
jgi:hypothetical protein